MNAKVDDKQALREEISQYLDTLANRVWKACLGRRGWKDTDIENDIIALIDAYTEERLVTNLENWANELQHRGNLDGLDPNFCQNVNGDMYKPCFKCAIEDRIAQLKASTREGEV